MQDHVSGDVADFQAAKLVEMQALIDLYTTKFPTHTPSQPASSSDVILLTGSTGALGANILAKLVASPTVSRVFALNRKGRSLKGRQVASLRERGITLSEANWSKVTLIEGDASLPGFGIDVELFNAVRPSFYIPSFRDHADRVTALSFFRSKLQSLISSTMV